MATDKRTLGYIVALVIALVTVAIALESAGSLFLAFAIAIGGGLWYGRKKGIEYNQAQA